MTQSKKALVEPASCDEGRNAALFKAASFGDYKLAKRMLATGANPNRPNNNGITPLMTAASEAHLEVVELLLQWGATVDARNEAGETALLYMALGENSVILADLINSLHHEYQRNEETAKEISRIKATYPRIVRLLLAAGSDVNSKDIYGTTPLHNFAGQHIPDCVLLLLEHGAEVNARDDTGEIPLMSTLSRESENLEETVKLLLEYGADVNIEDDLQYSALKICSQRPSNSKIMSLLLAASSSRKRTLLK